MEISFSPRENGACPVCRRAASCPVRQALAGSVKDMRGGGSAGPGLEVVIYSCPQFVEKPQP
jgi:hypothetical protein